MPAMLRVALVVVAAASSAVAQNLPTDPALVTGELDNGLRYIVRKHDNPPGRAVMWVHIHSGSLNETERQRGLAHYLEHMAFNGSTNFAPGSLVPFFQSLGMTFGRDQNAFTNFDQTTYQLSLPDTKPETLAKGMTFFSDVVCGLSLLPAEVDAERQIILEERRRGLSGRQRVSDYVQERIAPGSLWAVRDPIGTEETIKAVTPADFKDYYGAWYAPSNATLIVIADTEPAEVIKVINEKFASAPKRPRPAPQPVNVKAYDASFAIVASDPEIRSEDVRIVRLEPARPPTRTEAQYRADLVARLGTSALNRRLSDKVSRGGTNYLNARVSLGNSASAIHTAEISGRAKPGQWEPALKELALELQRARAFGFTAHELEDARKQMISNAEREVETVATMPAGAMIGSINNDVARGEPTMSPQQSLDLLRRTLPTITDKEVADRFAREFEPKAVAFVAVLPSSASIPSESELLEVGTGALAVKPTPEAETARAAALMTELPTPGTLKEGAEHAASKVWSGWLSNNTRVHHRFMDERKNEVSIQIALIGGELHETAANRGITQAAQLAWSRAATKHLASTDIRDLMTGKTVSVRGGGGFGGGGRGGRGGGGGGGGSPDSISLTVSGGPEDLETGMQLAYLLLTEPRIEAASFEQYKTTTRESLLEAERSPTATGARLSGAAPFPDDEPRTKPLTTEQLDRLTLEDSQAWLDRLIKESPIEVTIVGDLPRERATELVNRYIGSLPAREAVSPGAFKALRALKRPAGPRVIEKTIDTPTDQAYVFSGFYGADEANLADARALTMASRILSTRMVKQVREEAQLVYSIGSSARAATTFPGFGTFSAAAPTEPAKTGPLAAKLASMYEAFAKDGPTAEELDVAKKQFTNTYEEQMRDPGYWSGRIDRSTYRDRSLDDVVNEPAAFQALTAEQIKAAFAKYYSKDNAITVVVKPKAAPDGVKPPG